MRLTIVTDFDVQRARNDMRKAIEIAEARDRRNEREAIAADVGKPAVSGAKGAERPGAEHAGKPG